MACAIPADAAADDLSTAFDAALQTEGCHDAGCKPDLWYVNLVYFTGPVRAPDELVSWTDTRRKMKVVDLRVTEMQIVRWQHAAAGMTPIPLATATL
jgi:hypothetical protein